MEEYDEYMQRIEEEECEYTDKKKELDELREKQFMLAMADYWDADDYRYDSELHQRIMELENELGEVS